jgi:hypothetical protein
MARVWSDCRAVAAALASLAGLFLVTAVAQDQSPNAGTDLYERPVLAVDPRHAYGFNLVAGRR